MLLHWLAAAFAGPTDGHICRQDRMGVLGNMRRGLYAYQLEHWLRFFPPEQLLVVNYEQVSTLGAWGGSWRL